MNNLFTIKNFRVFDNEGATVDIKPMTILTGCNSSGKSSIVKGIYLVNDFISKIKEDYKEKHGLSLSRYKLDFSKRPNSLLGEFSKVVNKKSTDNSISFQYRVHSHMLCEDVNVEFVFSTLKGDDQGNGYLKSLSMRLDDGTNIYTTDTEKTLVDYKMLKKSFIRYIDVITRLMNIWKGLGSYFTSEIELNKAIRKRFKSQGWQEGIETLIKNSHIGEDDKQILTEKDQSLDQLYHLLIEQYSEAALNDLLYCFQKHRNVEEKDYALMNGIANYVKKYNILLFIPYKKDGEEQNLDPEIIKTTLNEKLKLAYTRAWEEYEKSEYYNPHEDDGIESTYKNAKTKLDIFFDTYKKSSFKTFADFLRDLEETGFYSLLSIILDDEDYISSPHFLFIPSLSSRTRFNKECSDESKMKCFEDFQSTLNLIMEHTEIEFRSNIVSSYFWNFVALVIEEILIDEMPNALSFVGSDVVQVKRLYTREHNDGFTQLLKKYVDEEKKRHSFRNGNKIEHWEDFPGKDGLTPAPNFGDFVSQCIRTFGIGERISITSVAEGEGIQVRIYEMPMN